MYNSTLHYVASMRRDYSEHETYEQYGAKLAQSFIDFDRSAEWIFEWARREITLNKETFRHTLLALKEIKPSLFDEVMSYTTPSAPAAPAPATAAPVATTAPVEVATAAPKAVPATTYEKCERYGASPYKCGCPDRAKRDGGSYTGLDGRPACKHMLHMQRYYTDIAI